MAEALVSGALKQLGSIIADELVKEARLVVCVKGEVEKLHSNLTAIRAVLTDAETRQVRDATVRDWLEKLKDVAYDIEDVLDDWKAAILSSQNMPGDERLERKVCSFLWSLMSLIPCFCCERVGPHYDIAHKIKRLNERLDRIAQEKANYQFVPREGNPPIERSMATSMIDITEVEGREEEKNVLVKKLLSKPSNSDGSNFHVLSIVGKRGIGKTTLAQYAFNHDRIKADFGDDRFWVCVSDPFDLTRVAKAILTRLQRTIPNDADLDYLLEKIRESIVGKRILLILDDVWEENRTNWDRLKQVLRFGLPGSKILITTRNEKVAAIMDCYKDNVLRVKNLGDEKCWLILSKIAFFNRSFRECEDLKKEFSKELAKKCKGLPLAAKTLGGILQFRKTQEEWQSILSSEVWEFEEAERDIIAPLWLSYFDLSHGLKRCFSYCAVFPKDYYFSKDELIELWMAQGYLEQRQNNNLEVNGEIYFQNLTMRSFFQDFEYTDAGSIDGCKMHDMVHDFAQMVARNECCNAQMVDDLVELIRTVRHLRLDLPNHGPYLNPSHGLKKKRSLFLPRWSKPTTDELSSLFGELTHVRSLSLRDGDFAEIPSSIDKLVQLRWLDLRSNNKLKQLPETLCELHSLQTLDVTWCNNLEQLPLGIGKLINLRHLHNLIGPSRLPKGIVELTGLRTLEEVDVGHDDEDDVTFSLSDLKNLNQLQGYLHIQGLGARDRHVGEANQAELKKKEHLTQLSLVFSDRGDEEERCTQRNEELLLEVLEPSLNLEMLQIHEYRGTTFPGWMISLKNLSFIYLSRCRLCEHLPSLGKLQSLKTLGLCNVSGVKKVGVEFLGIETQISESRREISTSSSSSSSSSSQVVVAFPKLTTLKFDLMESWEEWDDYYDGVTKHPASIMPSLCSLTIYDCPRLKALPGYILQNTTLHEAIF